MNWVSTVVSWLGDVTGWPVFPDILPDGQNYGLVYEAEMTGEVAHDDEAPGQYGPATVTVFVFHERLSSALSKAREVVHNVQDIVVPDGGALRGGQVAAQSSGQEPASDLFFVMLRLDFMYQEV